MTPDVDAIRRAMLDLGMAVQPRPMPQIVAADRDYCAGDGATIGLRPGASRHTLCHEMAHSQQASLGKAVAYRRDDGSIIWSAWRDDPAEIEAEAAAYLADARLAGDAELELGILAAHAAGVPLAVWAMSPAKDVRHFVASLPKLASAVAKLGLPLTPAWVGWLSRADIRGQKPERLGRRQRMAVNDWARAQTLRNS